MLGVNDLGQRASSVVLESNLYYAFVYQSGEIFLWKFRSSRVVERGVGSAGTDFREGELELELRVAGGRVEARAWPTDGARPDEAHVWIDELRAEGGSKEEREDIATD